MKRIRNITAASVAHDKKKANAALHYMRQLRDIIEEMSDDDVNDLGINALYEELLDSIQDASVTVHRWSRTEEV